jgi:hypothetical protein
MPEQSIPQPELVRPTIEWSDVAAHKGEVALDTGVESVVPIPEPALVQVEAAPAPEVIVPVEQVIPETDVLVPAEAEMAAPDATPVEVLPIEHVEQTPIEIAEGEIHPGAQEAIDAATGDQSEAHLVALSQIAHH